MAKIRISGDTSGYVELAAPAVAGNNTLILPANDFGKVLQVVSATHATEVSTTSLSYITTGLTATITPSSTANKVLILAQVPAEKTTDSIFSGAYIALFRGTVSGTILSENLAYTTGANSNGSITHVYVDSPSTTSAQTYTLGLKTNSSAVTVKSCPNGLRANIILMEIAA